MGRPEQAGYPDLLRHRLTARNRGAALLPEGAAHRLQTTDQCLLALQSGRQDVEILAALLGLAAVGKNPALGPYHLLTDPTVALPSCLGIQWEPDSRFEVV